MDTLEKKINRVCTLMNNTDHLISQANFQINMLEETMEEIHEEFGVEAIECLSKNMTFNERHEYLTKNFALTKQLEDLIDIDNYLE